MIKLSKFIYQKARGDKPKKLKPVCRHRKSALSAGNAVDAGTVSANQDSQTGLRYQDTERQDDECSICQKQKRDARIYRWKLICGLGLADLLSSLDLTIIATATPFISSHFDKFSELNWLVTAYTLTSTTFIPAFGQLADIFGRHAVLQLAMSLTLVGSVLCAAAQNWGMMLLGRALQGTSSAGIMNVIMIVLADGVSLKENAVNQSVFAFVIGVGYAIGPEIGGYLTDINWRYCFLIPIPIAVLSHILIYVLLRNDLMEGTHFKKGSRFTLSSMITGLTTLDIFGTILFIFGVGLIILGTAWGGSTYAWSSAEVVAPIAVGGVCFILLFGYEYLLEPGRYFARIFPRQTPMLPYSIFKRTDMIWLSILQFAAGAALYSVFYFIGIYFTLVEAYPASKAGVQLLYYIPGLGIGAYSAMYLCNVRPAQTFPPLTLGTILETLGLALLTWATYTQQTGLINGMLVLAGAGTGLRFMPCSLHVSGIWPQKIASGMSLMRFALPFGGTVGLTIMGSVFSNKLAAAAAAGSGGGVGADAARNPESLSFIADLPPAAQNAIRTAAKDAVMWAFVSIMPVLGVSLVSGGFLGNVWIKKRAGDDDEEEGDTGDGIASSEVIYVPYVWALVKGVNQYKHTSKPLSESERHDQAAAELEMRQLDRQ